MRYPRTEIGHNTELFGMTDFTLYTECKIRKTRTNISKY